MASFPIVGGGEGSHDTRKSREVGRRGAVVFVD
ncbi:hypothetical protein LINPERPRIM_LOCUS5948 [Linum perenne]